MLKIVIILLCLVIVLGILGIGYKLIYNRLQTLNIKLSKAEEIISEHLQKRYDYIVRTSHLVKKNLDLDIELFKEIENLKVKKVSNIEFDTKIKEGYETILKLQEDYLELNENRGFKDIINDFNESNETIEATKSYFDKYAKTLNETLSKFPNNIIGKIHGIVKREYYNTILEEKVLIDKDNY